MGDHSLAVRRNRLADQALYYDDAASILEQRILRMMLHLGMLKLGEEAAGTVVMMTPWGCEAAVPKHLLR